MVNVERVFDAPLDKVWALFEDVEMVKKWWGPEHFTAPLVEMDFKAGGAFVYCMHGAPGPGMPEQDFWNVGTFTAIEPKTKIVQAMSFANDKREPVTAADIGFPGEWADVQTITITFEEIDGKTKVSVTEEGIPEDMTHNASMGWEMQFDKIEKLF